VGAGRRTTDLQPAQGLSVDKRPEVETLQLELAETMHRFPLDHSTAQARWEAVNKARGEMFAMRLAVMARCAGRVDHRVVGRPCAEGARLPAGCGSQVRMGNGAGEFTRPGPPARQ